MVRRAIVHIGSGKTGTTSIQSFLELNRSALLAEDYAVPDSLGSSHEDLTLICRNPHVWDEVNAHDIGPGKQRPAADEWTERIAEKRKNIVDWANSTGSTNLVFTNESLSLIYSPDEISRLSELMYSIAGEVLLIVYVREPISFEMAMWSGALKAGIVSDPSISLPTEGRGLYLDRIRPREHWLAPWEDVFPGRLAVRLFDRAEFEGGSLLRDFCQAAGIPWRTNYVLPVIENKSLSWSMMKILNEVNRMIPGYKADGTVNPARGDLGYVMSTCDKGTLRFQPSVDEVRNYQQDFAQSNEWLRGTYFPDRARLWTTCVEPRDKTEDVLYEPKLTETEKGFAEFIIRVWPDFARHQNCSEKRNEWLDQINVLLECGKSIADACAEVGISKQRYQQYRMERQFESE